MKNLSQYLRFEATDKKGIENPSSPDGLAALVMAKPINTTDVCAHHTLQVPTQDNYCDCGLYLLHFAKVFMEDPAKSFHTILVSPLSRLHPLTLKSITPLQTKRKTPKADRDIDWKKALVGTSRENLTQRILGLSEVWVKERAKEVEEKAKAREREGTSKPEPIAVETPEDSGSDLEELDPEAAVKPKKPAAKRPEPTKKGPTTTRVKGKSSKTGTGPVGPERAPAARLR